MTIQEIAVLLNATPVTAHALLNREIELGFASDLMSDVLTLQNHNVALITGLANIQVVRTAEMSDIRCILLVRNKKATPDMIRLAEENNIVILEFAGSLFRAVATLAEAGMKPVF